MGNTNDDGTPNNNKETEENKSGNNYKDKNLVRQLRIVKIRILNLIMIN